MAACAAALTPSSPSGYDVATLMPLCAEVEGLQPDRNIRIRPDRNTRRRVATPSKSPTAIRLSKGRFATLGSVRQIPNADTEYKRSSTQSCGQAPAALSNELFATVLSVVGLRDVDRGLVDRFAPGRTQLHYAVARRNL